MKFFCFVFIFLLLSISLKAQFPPVGTMDFYGLKTVSEKQIREKLPFKEGGEMLKSKAEKREIEQRLETLPNVEEAQISPVCCNENGKTMIYVGIREKSAPKIEFRIAPAGSIRLTGEIIEIGKRFEETHREAVLKGDVGEDAGAGHSLMINAKARAVQERFIEIANQDLKLLRRVLRESADAEHRALAAQIIAYYRDKKAIVADLEFAVKDSDAAVRNNATRALGIIAGYAQKHPEKNIGINYEPFVDLLNSLEWTDRNKASLALNELTAGRSEKLLELLRKKAIPPLVEMARWKNEGHSAMAFFILGRVVGFSDDEIGQYWSGGRREELIQKFVKNK